LKTYIQYTGSLTRVSLGDQGDDRHAVGAFDPVEVGPGCRISLKRADLMVKHGGKIWWYCDEHGNPPGSELGSADDEGGYNLSTFDNPDSKPKELEE